MHCQGYITLNETFLYIFNIFVYAYTHVYVRCKRKIFEENKNCKNAKMKDLIENDLIKQFRFNSNLISLIFSNLEINIIKYHFINSIFIFVNKSIKFVNQFLDSNSNLSPAIKSFIFRKKSFLTQLIKLKY